MKGNICQNFNPAPHDTVREFGGPGWYDASCRAIEGFKHSDVLAWLGPEANGFGLASGGFGFQDLQARPTTVALAWLWLGLA
jgi:hypothetical protein